MSNCYTTFYFELPLPNPGVALEVESLLTMAEEWDSQESIEEHGKVVAPGNVGDIFEDFVEYEELGFDWEVRCHGVGEDMEANLIVYADESGNTTHAGNLIEWLLPQLDIKAAGFEYACYGDGENGGGAQAFIKTNDGIEAKYMSSYSWLKEALG